MHTVHVSDEFQRIEKLRRRFERDCPEVLIGIGDDAAILVGDGRPQVLSVDVAVEGVHFRRSLLSWEDVGRRATAAALSDLAAMGATPRAALSSLILPPDVDDAALDGIAAGIADTCAEHDAAVVGGNLARGGELSLTTTVVGHAPAVPLARTGARAGDGLYVTGELGAAALGLSWLLSGRDDSGDAAPFVARWRRPEPRVQAGMALSAANAHAAIDVSDGFLQDLEHMCTASGVGAAVDASALPVGEGFAELARELGRDPLDLALTGGEDYELLYAAGEGSPASALGVRVGRFLATPGLELRDAEGRPLRLPERRGFAHF